MKKRKDNVKACEECGHNRWKTVIKGKAWQCRNPKCGKVRKEE